MKLKKIIDLILQKFRFPRPFTADIELEELVKTRDELLDVLKRNAKYNFARDLALGFFFLADKIRIYINIYKVRFMCALIAAVMALAITGPELAFDNDAGYKHLVVINNKSESIKTRENKRTESQKEIIEQIKDEAAGPERPDMTFLPEEKKEAVRSRLVIGGFTAYRDTGSTAEELTNLFYKGLRLQKGSGRVVLKGAGEEGAVSRLSGSLNKIGNRYVLTVNITSLADGRVLLARKISYREGKDINDKLMALISQIATSEAIW